MSAEIKAKEIEYIHKCASSDIAILTHAKSTEDLLRFIATKLIEIDSKLAKINCQLMTDK